MTNLMYMQAPECLQLKTKIIGIITDQYGGVSLMLESTNFYVKGGGQLADTGVISASNFKAKVLNVIRDNTGAIYHICQVQSGDPVIGQEVECLVDKGSRDKNSKCHSGGHLIDLIVAQYANSQLQPIKGCHYPGSCFIEYQVQNPDMFNLDGLKNYIENNMQSYIDADYKFAVSFNESNKIKKLKIGDFESVACGGTHVKSSKELEGLNVYKIKYKKGNLKLSYKIV